MKKAFLFLLLLLPALLKAQDFSTVWKEAQKFKTDATNDRAIAVYEKEIQRVLSGEITYPDYQWVGLLALAGRYYKTGSNKYDNMLYGARAEKFREKIEFLKDAGVKYIMSFEVNDRTFGYIRFSYSSCTTYKNTSLIWLMNGHLYMQAFDECNTYKPLKLDAPEMVDLFAKHFRSIATDSLKRPNYMPEKAVDYHFKFYSDTDTLTKSAVSNFFLAAEKENRAIPSVQKDANLLKQDVQIYKRNADSYFGRMFVKLLEIERTYHNFINSGTERGKVGKID